MYSKKKLISNSASPQLSSGKAYCATCDTLVNKIFQNLKPFLCDLKPEFRIFQKEKKILFYLALP